MSKIVDKSLPHTKNYWLDLLKTVLVSPYFHFAVIIGWGIWITGTGFHYPFIFGDEGDGYYHGLQVRELREMGFKGLHVNHPFLFVFYLDFVTWLFGSFKEQLLRCSMMIFGLATGIVIYLMSYMTTKKRSLALLAGLTLFYLPVYSLFSQRVSHEAPTGFFMALTYLFHLKIILNPDNIQANKRLIDYSAIATALSCSFNFTGYFNALSWLLVFFYCGKELRKRLIISGALGFGIAFIFYYVIARMAEGDNLIPVMVATGKQRMTFGANPDGKGHVPVGQWFWETYIRRVGWVNPLALIIAWILSFFHPEKRIRHFFLMLMIVSHLNIFIFSTGAMGWICYFYYFAIPLALAPAESLRLIGEKIKSHKQFFYRWAPVVAAAVLFFFSQPYVKKAFITPGSEEDWKRYGEELSQMDRWFVTKPDLQPLYEHARVVFYRTIKKQEPPA